MMKSQSLNHDKSTSNHVVKIRHTLPLLRGSQVESGEVEKKQLTPVFGKYFNGETILLVVFGGVGICFRERLCVSHQNNGRAYITITVLLYCSDK